jgi:hypothetical protein
MIRVLRARPAVDAYSVLAFAQSRMTKGGSRTSSCLRRCGTCADRLPRRRVIASTKAICWIGQSRTVCHVLSTAPRPSCAVVCDEPAASDAEQICSRRSSVRVCRCRPCFSLVCGRTAQCGCHHEEYPDIVHRLSFISVVWEKHSERCSVPSYHARLQIQLQARESGGNSQTT